MPSLEQTGRYNLYTRPYEKGTSFFYLYDAGLLLYNNGGQLYGTGGFRPANTTDFAANLNVSGLNLTVGGVAITGSIPLTIANPVYSVYVTGGYLGLTGVPNVSIQGTPNVAITNTPNVIINSGSFALTSSILTSGQTQIPVGARSYSVAILSGNAWINGVGPYIAPVSLGGGTYDGHWTVNTAINVGLTGGYGLVAYES